MRDSNSSGGLHVIFAIFLGLMVTAFVGVGVYTFLPAPWDAVQQRLTELTREEQLLGSERSPDALTADERDALEAARAERYRIEDERRIAQRRWMQTTSIVLVVVATLVMALSLTRPVRLPVISNGLLLSGVFTMLYGVGWIVASESSTLRFLVLTAALAVTLAMGYLRFVRGAAPAAVPAMPGQLGDADLAVLLERLDRLEARLADAGRALRDDPR